MGDRIVPPQLTAADIRWSFTPGPPWPVIPSPRLAVEALSVVEDEVAISVIEALGLTVADLIERLAAVRCVLGMALDRLASEQGESARLRGRLHALLDARRAAP